MNRFHAQVANNFVDAGDPTPKPDNSSNNQNENNFDTSEASFESKKAQHQDLSSQSKESGDLGYTPPVPEKPASPKVDLNLAHLSTLFESLSFVGRFFEYFMDDKSKDYRSMNPLTEIFAKLRNLVHYSIHAKPASPNIKADDIRGDSSHNLAAVKLGIVSYAYYAFIGPWAFVAKHLLGMGEKKGLIHSLADRIIRSVDETIVPKITNMYWNIRRISMAFIPAQTGDMTSKQVEEAGDTIQKALGKIILASSLRLPDWFLDRFSFIGWDRNSIIKKLSSMEGDSVKQSMYAFDSFTNNINTLITGEYKSSKGGTRKLGEEDPGAHTWFLKSKLLSHILGLPCAGAATVCNTLGMTAGVAGTLLNSKKLGRMADKLGDVAMALQNTLYATDIIPAQLHVFLKDVKANKVSINSLKSLGIFGLGAIAAALAFIRPFVNSRFVHKFTNSFFKLFFSTNRQRLHEYEFKQAYDSAMERDKEEADKLPMWSLPLRILFGDKNYTYPLTEEGSEKYYQENS